MASVLDFITRALMPQQQPTAQPSPSSQMLQAAPQMAQAPPENPIFTRNIQWAKPGPYTTPLDPTTEQAFRGWVADKKIPFNPDDPKSDYDMRGFYKAMISGDPSAKRSATNLHFPDTWKTPYHKSFSNESIYALPHAPKWQGNSLIGPNGETVFSE